MHLLRKDFQMWRNHVYILPSVEIVINDMMYCDKNVAICFHWMTFNVRFLFLESEV